jgi:hypothetical protein
MDVTWLAAGVAVGACGAAAGGSGAGAFGSDAIGAIGCAGAVGGVTGSVSCCANDTVSKWRRACAAGSADGAVELPAFFARGASLGAPSGESTNLRRDPGSNTVATPDASRLQLAPGGNTGRSDIA